MSLIREHHESRGEWLEARANRGIGASEAAAIVNLSPYESVRGLWEKKVLNKRSADISDNEAVAKGVRVEPALRALFQANHPELTIEYYPYDLLFQEDRPWMFCTLDGEIVREDGMRGILEIKTATPNGREGWRKWECQIPNHYHCQILHQFLATGFDFAILCAGLYGQDGTMTIREYEVTKEDVAIDMEWLLNEEISFWESVSNKKLPPLTLVI